VLATISGGHLVAKALKAEGVEAIFTLCGGHIIASFLEIPRDVLDTHLISVRQCSG
jgi:thiamine pyrophosphate-dependent acetolactate synthase large subunit-like protein